MGQPYFKLFGICYMLASVLVQFANYEFQLSKYYFYYNLGWSRGLLWVFNVLLSVVIGLIFFFLGWN